jgi:nucleoid DNA-binding protein
MATGPKTLSKSEIINAIAENTGLARKQVNSVFAALSTQIESAVGKKGPGVFALPGLVKITVKAKPARNVIKVRPLKALKDMAK